MMMISVLRHSAIVVLNRTIQARKSNVGGKAKSKKKKSDVQIAWKKLKLYKKDQLLQ